MQHLAWKARGRRALSLLHIPHICRPRGPMNSGATESAPSPPATPPEMRAAAAGNRPRPSLLDIVFVIWAVIIPIGFGYRLLNSDGDLARHLQLGRMMLEKGGLLERDTFSHTAAGQPFPYPGSGTKGTAPRPRPRLRSRGLLSGSEEGRSRVRQSQGAFRR